MTSPRRGLRFEHAGWRKSVAGLRFEDSPPVVCVVTKVSRGTVYYRPVDDTGTGNPWHTSVDTFAEKVARVLPDEPRATPVRVAMVGGSGAWRGALRQGTRTLVECGHPHRNRDTGMHVPARRCAERLVRAARNEHTAAAIVEDAAASAAVARGLGAQITDAQARTRAAATVAAWREVVLAHDFHLPPPPGVFVNVPACGCCPTTREDAQ